MKITATKISRRSNKMEKERIDKDGTSQQSEHLTNNPSQRRRQLGEYFMKFQDVIIFRSFTSRPSPMRVTRPHHTSVHMPSSYVNKVYFLQKTTQRMYSYVVLCAYEIRFPVAINIWSVK